MLNLVILFITVLAEASQLHLLQGSSTMVLIKLFLLASLGIFANIACFAMGKVPVSNDFNPLTTSTDLKKYELDKEACLRELKLEVGENVHENAAIAKFRRCLIDKGYVLLS